MITIKCDGTFERSESFLKRLLKLDIRQILEKYGRLGVEALRAYTPVDSGVTADSWDYEIEMGHDTYAVYYTNSNINKGVPIAIILQYGHGTNNGGYVQGRDYINPALRDIFDNLTNEVWKEVTRE